MVKLFLLFMKLSSPRIPVPLDKQAHFATGAIGGFIVTYFLGFIGGVSVITILAFAKEVYDAHNTGHTSDVWDWVATTLGAILGAGLWQLIYHL
jgi:VanZ family protein